MILKETDNKKNLNKLEKFGFQAEKQMSFYLKRAFQDSQNIFIINDLRLESDGDVAQIDHLIIHKFGFLIVESKSVTSKITINSCGEWSRQYLRKIQGMPSPVNQAKRQADFLNKYLMPKSELLLKKRIILQGSISDFNFDVLVAISDKGIITRSKDSCITQVFKADQITDEIKIIISNYADEFKNLLNLKACRFSLSTQKKIANYLVQSHKPKIVLKEKIVKKPESTSTPEKRDHLNSEHPHYCSKCKSKNVEIVYGKYGYYFKCLDCSGNTSIKLKCERCACKIKLRKDKLKFYKECTSCNTSLLFFENSVNSLKKTEKA